MTTIVHNPKSLNSGARDDWPAWPLLIAWPCTRLAPGCIGRSQLECVRFVLGISPQREHDHKRCIVEAWLEHADGSRRPIHGPQAARCRVSRVAGMLHLDACDDDGSLLAAISMQVAGTSARPLYAQSPLLSRAGFHAAGHDAPIVLSPAHSVAAAAVDRAVA